MSPRTARGHVQIREVTCPHLELTFRRPGTRGGDVKVRVPTYGGSTLRFRLSEAEQKRRHVFHGVTELLDYRPLYVRALGVSAARDLPAAVLKVGSVLQSCASYTIIDDVITQYNLAPA